MNVNTELTNMQALYIDNHLADLFDMLDQLHSAASEGRWQMMTAMSKRELLSFLRDLVYTAQETIGELGEADARPNVVLRLMEKPLADKRQA